MPTIERVTKHSVTLRWFKRHELDDLRAVDEAVFPYPWSRGAMEDCLIMNNNLCLVAEDGGRIIGFLIFEIQRDRFYVLKMGVVSEKRRMGVGSAMLQELRALQSGNRSIIEIDVRESLALDDKSYRFYERHGFKGVGMERDFFKVYSGNHEKPTHVESSIKFVAY